MKKDSFLGKLVYGYDKLEEYVLCASLVLTTLIIFVQVIMRSVFNSSLTWSEELTRYIFIWQTWMGVSIAQKDKAHIKVEILKSFVKNQKVIAVVDVIATILLIAFNIFLVTSGVELVQQMISRGNVSSAMRMPMWIVYIVLPLASGIFTLRLLAQVVQDIKGLFGRNIKLQTYLSAIQNRGVSEQIREGFVVEDEDITNLPVGQAIIGAPGCQPFRFQFKRYG